MTRALFYYFISFHIHTILSFLICQTVRIFKRFVSSLTCGFLYNPILKWIASSSKLQDQCDDEEVNKNVTIALEPELIIIKDEPESLDNADELLEPLPSAEYSSHEMPHSSTPNTVLVFRYSEEEEANTVDFERSHRQSSRPQRKATEAKRRSTNTRRDNSNKPFSCDRCRKSYTMRCNLNRHRRVECNRQPKHACPVCLTKFYYRCSLAQHAKTTHDLDINN